MEESTVMTAKTENMDGCAFSTSIENQGESLWNDSLMYGTMMAGHQSMTMSNSSMCQHGKASSSSKLTEIVDDADKSEQSTETTNQSTPMWNGSLGMDLPQSPYHPMLMMMMMMMNMEHKTNGPVAGNLNPMANATLIARLNEFNHLATAAATNNNTKQIPVNSNEPNETLTESKDISDASPLKRKQRSRSTTNGSNRSNRTKAVSVNRQLVTSTVTEPNEQTSTHETPNQIGPKLSNPIYRCHLCPYTGNSKLQFNAHMNTHFDHRCPHCDYTSRTEGRLKRHIRDFHSETPPETWSGNRTRDCDDPFGEGDVCSGDDSNSDAMVAGGNGPNPARNRKYRCKQCNYVAIQKHDYWEHTKQHIKMDKMLSCPKCNFVTEFKHHLVYHLRNHFGSKPFKCGKCNYSCVNKSMLNSHMKSHSNIYQYRCEDCTYATKYCHSLKLHLRKYNHRPATVLNLDGTPNPYPVIDVYGTRRGPRPKKNSQLSTITTQSDDEQMINETINDDDAMMMDEMSDSNEETKKANLSISSSASSISSTTFDEVPAIITSCALEENKVENGDDQKGKCNIRTNGSNGIGANFLKCDYCSYSTESKQQFSMHLLNHVMNEKQTLIQKSKSAKKVKVETKPEPMAKMPQLKPTLGNNHSTPVNINTSTSSFELASNAPEAIMFTSGELTPPTPTIGQSNEQQFKPLDLSGDHQEKLRPTNNKDHNLEQEIEQCPIDSTDEQMMATNNPTMALILMNNFLMNAQRNLKDVLDGHSQTNGEENGNSESMSQRKESSPITDVSIDQTSKREELNQLQSDEEHEEKKTFLEEGPLFTMGHELPPTPNKSPPKANIFDFTDDDLREQQSSSSMLQMDSQLQTQQHQLAPAIVQLLGQLLQLNPTINPTIVVQQLLPHLLADSNCNSSLETIANLLNKVYNATSIMQEIMFHKEVMHYKITDSHTP